MKMLARLILILFATLAVLVFAGRASAQTTRPRILIGADAQPIENFDKMKLMGMNAVHRYESGPSKNVTLSTWVTAADKAGLYSIIQGIEAESQGVDFASLPATVVGIAQGDEPDLNRWPATGTATQQAEAAKIYYTPTDAPHPSVTGWTRPEVLQSRYLRWKSKTALPIVANFAGPSINSGYYKPDLMFHVGYIGAADVLSSDTYPANANNGPPYSTYWPSNVVDKLNAASKGKCKGSYIECAFGRGGFKRGPTTAEQSTITWSLAGHIAQGFQLLPVGSPDRTVELWYFTQCVNPPFSYWALTPENEAAAKTDIAGILAHADLICDGRLTVVQTPKAQNNNYTAPGGVLVWPKSEVFSWELNGEKLVVSVNYETPTTPVVTYTRPQAPDPIPPTPVPDPSIAALKADVAAIKAESAANKAAIDAIRAGLKAAGN